MDVIKGIIDQVFREVILKIVIDKIVAKIPFLAFPIINPIFGWIVGWIGGQILDEMQNAIELKLIDMKVDGQKDDYNEAVEKLKVIVDKPDKTPEELEAAKNELKKRLHDLVSLKLK